MLSLSHMMHEGFIQLATALWYSIAILPGLALALKSPPPRRRRGAPDRVSDLFEALDAFPFFVVMEDADYTIRFMNNKLRGKFGNRTGEKCYHAFIGRESPCPVCPVRAILHEGKEWFTYFPQDRDGLWYESSSAPLTMPDGSTVVIEILRDITERKKAEKVVQQFTKALKQLVSEKTDELRQSEERYRNLFENASDAIFTIDPAEDRILSANHMAEAITGCRTKELLAMKHSRLYLPGELEKVVSMLREAPRGAGIHTTVQMLRKDGTEVPVDISATTVAHAGKEAILAICRDISQRLILEKRMRELASVVETMRPSVIITDLNQRIIYANPAAQKMLGYREEEMIGQLAREIFEGISGNPSDLGRSVREEAQNGYWEGEIFNRKKSGEIIPVFLRMCMIKNEKGELIGYAGISEDITRRKRMEGELIQKEKLLALGEFTSAMAHEINNPLTGVLGYAEILQQAESPKDFREDVQRLYKEAIRCQCLVKNLLTFARRSTPHKELSNINEIIEKSIDLKGYQLKADQIEVVTHLDRSIPTSIMDPHQIQQVFLNIIDNAHHALKEQRGIRRITVTSALKDGTIAVSFSDNGPPIPAEIMDKIFLPFFTTKEFGQGTGLGLSIVHGIIKEHGGEIRVQSEEGKETTFTVAIPFGGS
jgi:PAS domain S-box-containing protein